MQDVELPLPRAEQSPWRGRAKRAAIVTLAASPFLAGMALKLPMCPSASLLGVPCPGCGLTRATIAALTGNLSEALHLHPLVFLLTPIYVGFLLTAGFTYVRGAEPVRPPSKWLTKAVGILFGVALVLMIAVWMLRFFGLFGGPVPVETYRLW